MKNLFIINPVAGGKKSDKKKTAENIERLMTERDEDYEIYFTVAPMDAAEKVKREAIKGVPLRVYACGGDGTLSECVHGAAGYRNAAVTHYPCGTGNDFVRSFGENAALFSDLEALVEGESAPIDILDVNGRKCVNIFSVGIDARVGIDVHKYSKLPLIGGAGGYVISLIINLIKGINRHFTVTTDDGTVDGLFALICACNGQYYGGGFHPTRDARPDDGVMDILIVNKVSRLKALRLLPDYADGGYAKYPDVIRYVAGRHLKIEDDKEFSVNVDGEAIYAKSVSIRLIPDGVNFIYPRGYRPPQQEEKAASGAQLGI